ncbi:hypothetical protein [Rhodosalinus sp. 5P4]|uniref:hypothetical protein n=1 Tax=Rhodosalinus sp. 5P4 TaxID=3239196 RepID=UPI0035252ECA
MDTETDIKRDFTIAERADVRDALLRYMSERGIGAPTLYDEICRHDPLRREMSMRTLQRFLAHAHQTQDLNVSMCYEFARALPYFSAEQHVSSLGAALGNFTATPHVDSDWLRRDRIALDVRYSSAMHTGEGLSMVRKGASFSDLMPYSTLVLERRQDGPFFRTSETIHNPFPDQKTAAAVRLATEGIAVPVEDRYLLWIGRDSLTRRPRSTIWTLEKNDNYSGAYLLVIAPQNPDGEEDRYVSPIRLFARVERDAEKG